MTTEEKVAAFDDLALAMTNQWASGHWTWFCPSPCGGADTPRCSREEAVADLVAWAQRTKKRQTGYEQLQRWRNSRRIPLAIVSED